MAGLHKVLFLYAPDVGLVFLKRYKFILGMGPNFVFMDDRLESERFLEVYLKERCGHHFPPIWNLLSMFGIAYPN